MFGTLQHVSAVYPRLGVHEDATLPVGAEDLIAGVQQELHLSYHERRFTNDVDDPVGDSDNYRLRLPCEVLVYELTGMNPEDAQDITTADPRDNRYFSIDELRSYRLSEFHQTAGTAVTEIAYHEIADTHLLQKRLVDHSRSLFFKEDLSGPEAFRTLNRLGIPHETFQLALIQGLLDAVFGTKLTAQVRARLADPATGGYLSGADLTLRFGANAVAGQYWRHTGVAGFGANAAQHFYFPTRYTDPFGQITRVVRDGDDLFVASRTDPADNSVRVVQFDYRVLAPREIQDPNLNFSEVVYDILGRPTAMALKERTGGQPRRFQCRPRQSGSGNGARIFQR
jgi:YD repeat-containing protein